MANGVMANSKYVEQQRLFYQPQGPYFNGLKHTANAPNAKAALWRCCYYDDGEITFAPGANLKEGGLQELH